MTPNSLVPELSQRVFIEDVLPQVDGGHYAAKSSLYEDIPVHATIHTDGTDVIAAQVIYRQAGEAEWRRTPMRLINAGKDLWEGHFALTALGRGEFKIEAWIDSFASWREKLIKKEEAAQDIEQDLREGALLVKAAADRAQGADKEALLRAAEALDAPSASAGRGGMAKEDKLVSFMQRHADREPVTSTPIFPIQIERERARMGAWYEMFPRSAGSSASRSATLQEAEGRLAGIAEMGFDIVYLPPVHPIGKSFRKGPNNNPDASPGDPGSPWAIGSEEGGHKSIAPELGTLDDFDHFVKAAAGQNLEVALDLAYQCSPDHPYTREHPEWFHRRPDGSIHYAENPPKKYEDIYPFDFECKEWRALWQELKSIVLFWIDHGVKIFRVDNPHTKPIHFWEWLISEIHSAYPDVIFLGEAFTRPAVMGSLAKVGFSQSYTYFTWRNTKEDLTEYFTELILAPVRDYLRPNLFTTTPDILPAYLQTGGRPAFQIRLILAATLGASYGIYGPPFELCEARAVPGTEDYADSEKYQIRHWDWNAPGNIKPLISKVNRIRKDYSALHFNANLRFYSTDNPNLMAYGKSAPDGSHDIIVIVNLDPYNVQSGWVQIPRAELFLPDPYEALDLLTDQTFHWHGDSNFVQLNPFDLPAHILRLTHEAR